MTDIKSMTIEELKGLMTELGEKPFRAKQIYSWLHEHLVTSYDQMENIPKSLRQKLEQYPITVLETLDVQISKIDGTRKYLFRLSDGNMIESVLMKYKHGNSVCISSQAGCRMGCTFCASTLNGLSRNLLPSEMTGQVIAAQKDLGEKVSNIVMMGIGEPLDNYDNVKKFLTLVNCPEGLNIGLRHISLSTCGLCDKIRALADEKLQITLSVSLHASDSETRKALMPVARKFELDELMDACRYYISKTGRRISFEYSMIHGKNDTPECAENLKKLLSGMLCHVNLIPLNDVKERNYTRSSREAIQRFSKILEDGHITVTVRRKLGSDINASCGQLRAGNAK